MDGTNLVRDIPIPCPLRYEKEKSRFVIANI